MDMEQARFNMVEQQVRPWEVLDQQVLDLLGVVAREEFLPEAYRELAYADLEIPIGHGQMMLPPRVQGRALQALEVKPSDRALEIGTGTGYLTALLARLAHQVVSVEINPELAEQAAANLASAGCTNATVETGDGSRGWPDRGPYDVILVSGALPRLPDELRQQLRPGGRLFAVVGREPAMEAVLVVRTGDRQWSEQTLFETVVPPLSSNLDAPQFTF